MRNHVANWWLVLRAHFVFVFLSLRLVNNMMFQRRVFCFANVLLDTCASFPSGWTLFHVDVVLSMRGGCLVALVFAVPDVLRCWSLPAACSDVWGSRAPGINVLLLLGA